MSMDQVERVDLHSVFQSGSCWMDAAFIPLPSGCGCMRMKVSVRMSYLLTS